MQTDTLLKNKVALYKLIHLCQEYRDGILEYHKHMLRISSLFGQITSDMFNQLDSEMEEGLQDGIDPGVTLTSVVPDDLKRYWEGSRVITRKFHFYKKYGFHLKKLSKENRIISHKLQYELHHISLKVIVPLKIFDKQCSHFLKHAPCGGKKVSAYELKQVDRFIDLIPQFWNAWFLSFYSIFYRIHFLLYLQSNQLLIEKLNTNGIAKKELDPERLTINYLNKTKILFADLENLFCFPD
ncbi:uncharacterized protein RNJ42_00557 [Nakaseomyces bracarensis]|uniref:uncharacterized protein n=1 Tax=Nakaseomyces bracarensis TaxID=273131 RepID=UPI003871661E